MTRFLGVHRSYGGCRIWGPSHQPFGSRQRAFERRPDKLAPRSHAGLVEQLLHGGLNGAHRNAEIGPNLLVRKPCENAQEHLLLSLCQDVRRSAVIAWREPIHRLIRSEERRVGKERRSRWSPCS